MLKRYLFLPIFIFNSVVCVSFVAGGCLQNASDQAATIRQDDSEDLGELDFIDVFPGGNVYGLAALPNGVMPAFLPDYGHAGIKLLDFRFLELPEVQTEIGMKDEQISKLNSELLEIYKYDTVWKWEHACVCEPLKAEALSQTEQLKHRINETESVKEILTPEQFERLRQLQRRFFLFSLNGMPGNFGRRFIDKLFVEQQQKKEILKQIRKTNKEFEEDNTTWEDSKFTKEIQRILGEEQLGLLREVSESCGFFSRDPLLRSAQMSRVFVYRDPREQKHGDRELLEDNSVNLFFDDLVIVPNGRFAPQKNQSTRGRLYVNESKWQRLALVLNSPRSSWFALVDFQQEEIGKLVKKNELDGGFFYTFAGDEKITEFTKSASPDIRSDARSYRDYETQLNEFRDEQNRNIESTILNFLAPIQVIRLQFAVGAAQFPKTGVYVGLHESFLGPEFKLDARDRRRLESAIKKRRAFEIDRLNKFEKHIFRQLKGKQRKAFMDLFGGPTDLFPSFLYSLDSR